MGIFYGVSGSENVHEDKRIMMILYQMRTTAICSERQEVLNKLKKQELIWSSA